MLSTVQVTPGSYVIAPARVEPSKRVRRKIGSIVFFKRKETPF